MGTKHECSICLENLSKDVASLQCGHLFHFNCIQTHIDSSIDFSEGFRAHSSATCPKCRFSINCQIFPIRLFMDCGEDGTDDYQEDSDDMELSDLSCAELVKKVKQKEIACKSLQLKVDKSEARMNKLENEIQQSNVEEIERSKEIEIQRRKCDCLVTDNCNLRAENRKLVESVKKYANELEEATEIKDSVGLYKVIKENGIPKELYALFQCNDVKLLHKKLKVLYRASKIYSTDRQRLNKMLRIANRRIEDLKEKILSTKDKNEEKKHDNLSRTNPFSNHSEEDLDANNNKENNALEIELDACFEESLSNLGLKRKSVIELSARKDRKRLLRNPLLKRKPLASIPLGGSSNKGRYIRSGYNHLGELTQFRVEQ